MSNVAPAQCYHLAGVWSEVEGFVSPIAVAVGFHIVADQFHLLPFAIDIHIHKGCVDAVFSGGVVDVQLGLIVDQAHRALIAPPETELILACGRHANVGRGEVGCLFHLVRVCHHATFASECVGVGTAPSGERGIFHAPAEWCEFLVVEGFNPWECAYRMVGLGAERPHWAVGGIAHAVVRYHFPVVGGAVFGLCEFVGSGCAAIRAVHHVELAVFLAYVNLVAFGKLSLTPFELHIFDKHIGLALLWSLHFATGGHAFAAIQVGKQHAVDEISGPFVNASFRRIGHSRVFKAQAQVVGVVLREVDFHIDKGISLGVVAQP